MFIRFARCGFGVCLALGVLLLPVSAFAQPVLSVSPESVSLMAYQGSNAPQQSLEIRNAGNRALKWSASQPAASWLTLTSTNGVNSGSVGLRFLTSGLPVGTHQTTFVVSGNGSTMTIPVQLIVVAPPAQAPKLVVSCPANMTVPSPNGSPMVVSYSPTVSGGTAPVTMTSTPTSGSSFEVGTKLVSVVAQSGDGQNASCTFSVTVTNTTPKLAVSCPANKSVASSNGSPMAVTYSATTSGGVAPVTVSGSPASGSLFSVGTTPVSVTARSNDGQTASCGFSVTVTYTAPAQLTVSCPANMSVPSSNGSPVAVTYSATSSGGIAPVTVSVSPVSSSLFAVGTTFVTATARSSDSQTVSCAFSVTVTYTAPPPPPPASAVGPQSTITCPSGAVSIYPGSAIQGIVDTNPGNTTFCLRAGTHSLRSSITPKTGDTFVGEYGAILDGTGWSTSDDTQAAFRAHNQDIDYVTIRNLVIRNMPQRGIHAYYWMSDHWTVEYNEIAASKNVGIVFPAYSNVRNNYIHHNVFGGYMTDRADNTTLEGNEIAYNGTQQKVSESANVTFRNNFVHHNQGAGIWYDSDNTGSLVEGNRIEDNGTNGIWYEIGTTAIIRNNVIRRSGDTAVFISTSKNTEIYNNTLENNFRGITYFVNCPSVGGGAIVFDLANNSAHDNNITVGTQLYAFAGVFNYASCTSAQVAPYLNGSKNLTFSHNTYHVPSASGQYWYWSLFKYWNEWQGLGLDLTGTVSQ